MSTVDYVLLVLIGVYALFAARRIKEKCGGNCSACCGCTRAK